MPPRARTLSPSFTRVDARGTLHELMNDGAWKSVLYGRMKRHATMGRHFHKRTVVLFFLTEGRAEIRCVDARTARERRITLRAMQGLRLPVWTAHTIRFLAPSAFVMLKSTRYHPARPDTFPYPAP